MTVYILLDSANLYHRSKHVASRKADLDSKIGLAFSIIMNSVRLCYHKFQAEHVVFFLEGNSWRKEFYPPFKAHRRVAQQAKSVREQEEDAIMFKAYDNLTTFLETKTNVTMMRHPEAEGDDMIALFIEQHPNDTHIIVSGDSDFQQLLAPNVKIYDGVQNRIITTDGVFNDDKNMTRVLDKKTKKPLSAPDPEWVIFEKCVRGETGDNIFSAYPGARMKGTKNKVGVLDAYNDRNSGGYYWNNFMLQRWIDHNGIEHVVKTDYERNRTLIDLRLQPPDKRESFIATIKERSVPKQNKNVGIHFLRWCGEWDLKRLSDTPDDLVKILGKPYPA